VVQEGQDVEALVLSVDPEAQRMSLSLKALESRSVPQNKELHEDDVSEADSVPEKAPAHRRPEVLKGGLDRPSGGDKFGLRW
jgi:small subunit ribosomal protein S1